MNQPTLCRNHSPDTSVRGPRLPWELCSGLRHFHRSGTLTAGVLVEMRGIDLDMSYRNASVLSIAQNMAIEPIA